MPEIESAIHTIDLSAVTKEYVKRFGMQKYDDKVMYRVQKSVAEDFLARVRVALSRIRQRLKREGKRFRAFKLCSELFHDRVSTTEGIEYIEIQVWTTQTRRDSLDEALADLLEKD